MCLCPTKKLYLTKLFVCNNHNANIARIRHKRLYSLHMYIRILSACTMTNID